MPIQNQQENMSQAPSGLGQVFSGVAAVLAEQRQGLNAADSVNSNHGDHMVEIFEVASSTASALITCSSANGQPARMADILFEVGRHLDDLPENGTALVYAQGLKAFALEFQSRNIELPHLEAYVRQVLDGSPVNDQSSTTSRGKDVLKALVNGLVSWRRAEKGQPSAGGLDLGALFEFGIIYLQAKEAGGSRAEIIAWAAAMATPLSKIPYRLQSGRIALQALLHALQTDAQGS